MPAFPEDASGFKRSTKVIAVADVVESVRLMEQDEQEFIRRWQRFVGFVQQLLPPASGRLHKSLGDGLMLEFSDPEGCIRAAVAMRAWFADANRGLSPEDQVQLRIGAHRAEFVADAYDIYGTDVNLAARIASLAGPGEIVISAALREHLGPGLQAQLEDLGTCHVKHVKDPVHAFRIGAAGQAPVMPARRLASHTLRPTLAVLPFALHGHAPGEPTGEALADDIVAALSRSELLQVVSRLSSAPFGGGQASLAEVRRLLGAHYVLAGRARREGEDLSLFIELAETGSGHVTWAQSFHGPVREAALTDGRLLREVVAALHAGVVTHEVERSRDAVLPALEGFTLLLASIGLMHWMSEAETQRARAMLEHLVERGRGHPEPHAWLAHLQVLRLRQADGAGAAPEAASARERAATAVLCDPGAVLALAMEGQALVHAARDFDAAEERYAQALMAQPHGGFALLLQAELRALQGRGDAAWQDAQRGDAAFVLEPLRGLADSIGALAALVAGQADAAQALAQRAVDRNPRFLPALRSLVVAQVRSGRLAEARRSAQRLAARQPGATVAGLLAAWPACGSVADLFADALRQAGVPPG